MRSRSERIGKIANLTNLILKEPSAFVLILYCLDVDLKAIKDPSMNEESRIAGLCYTLYGVLLDREMILFFQRFGGD